MRKLFLFSMIILGVSASTAQEQAPLATHAEAKLSAPKQEISNPTTYSVSSDIKAMLTPGEKVLYKTSPHSYRLAIALVSIFPALLLTVFAAMEEMWEKGGAVYNSCYVLMVVLDLICLVLGVREFIASYRTAHVMTNRRYIFKDAAFTKRITSVYFKDLEK